MSLSAHPRRTSGHLTLVRSWLENPTSRLLLPKSVREAIEWLVQETSMMLVDPSHTQTELAAAPLVRRPSVGAHVSLIQHDPFLEQEAGAVVGSIGVVVDYSHLSADDDGVLVDWGNGRRIRSDLAELSLA